MHSERRRYFRIDESVGVGYELLNHKPYGDGLKEPESASSRLGNMLDAIEEQDEKIEHLLSELENESPKVAEVIGIFNQKLERVINHLLIDSQTISRIAHKVREANISACGIAFVNNEYIEPGANLQLKLTLTPSDACIETKGRVIGCDPNPDGESYYWRIDFFGMDKANQELLIQHIVRTQSVQLKNKP